MCINCRVIRRGKKGGTKVIRVICSADKRHKQRQG